jgi:hypothetical protein
MGSHGQYGFKDHILGTNTYSMLRRSKVPVVVVKENNKKPKLKTLVVATNLEKKQEHLSIYRNPDRSVWCKNQNGICQYPNLLSGNQ